MSPPPQFLHNGGADSYCVHIRAAAKCFTSRARDVLKALPMRVQRLPVIPTRVNRRRECWFTAVNWYPGVAASLDVLPLGAGPKRGTRSSAAQAAGARSGRLLGRAPIARLTSAFRGSGSQNIYRLNNAVRVAGPDRICVLARSCQLSGLISRFRSWPSENLVTTEEETEEFGRMPC